MIFQQTYNSDFDVNILEDALTRPNVELTFPLPTDRDTYLPLRSNEKVSTSFQLLEHFIKFFTKISIFDIYKNAEFRYSINNSLPKFNDASDIFMNERLENSDKKLDDIVYDLVDSELRMSLIKARQFKERFQEVKAFMVNFYKQENKKNLPRFGSQRFIRLCYITVIKILAKMFPQGVWTSREQFSNLYKSYLDNPMSVILLPNHQSHIDYVILHVIMIRFQMSIPTVIAGNNLNVAIFGSILKGLGGIFIKRSFNNELYTERNLTNYLEFIFLNKIHLEVFIEGTRSRDGKLLLPKYGILKALAAIYDKQRVEESNPEFDLMIQPVSITYERIYETDGYLRELIGKDKEQESFSNILSNGLSNLFSRADTDQATSYSPEGFVDNLNKDLNGKIYIKLAKSFTFSSYANNPENLTHDVGETYPRNEIKKVNLKKLGFTILHAINDVSYLPECAIVGTTIQTFCYFNGRKEFATEELIPMMNFLIGVFEQEELGSTNKRLMENIKALSDIEKIALIEFQTINFFKYTQVNPHTRKMRVMNTFELLYYKNLTVHLIIHKCLVSLILLKTSDILKISKLYYVFTGFLKNEFLFDYDFKISHDLSNILKKYQLLNLISENFKILDPYFHEVLAAIIHPFIDSFGVCIDNLTFTVANFQTNATSEISEKQLLNDDTLLKDYPTTKSLLKIMQRNNVKNFDNESSAYHIETYNKQYLLSVLYYLDNLKLIKILKNKSKSKAFVIIENSKDLQFILTFMNNFKDGTIAQSEIGYMIDIVDKSFERHLPLHDAQKGKF